MTDFFATILERSGENAPVIQPMIPPLFSPVPWPVRAARPYAQAGAPEWVPLLFSFLRGSALLQPLAASLDVAEAGEFELAQDELTEQAGPGPEQRVKTPGPGKWMEQSWPKPASAPQTVKVSLHPLISPQPSLTPANRKPRDEQLQRVAPPLLVAGTEGAPREHPGESAARSLEAEQAQSQTALAMAVTPPVAPLSVPPTPGVPSPIAPRTFARGETREGLSTSTRELSVDRRAENAPETRAMPMIQGQPPMPASTHAIMSKPVPRPAADQAPLASVPVESSLISPALSELDVSVGDMHRQTNTAPSSAPERRTRAGSEESANESPKPTWPETPSVFPASRAGAVKRLISPSSFAPTVRELGEQTTWKDEQAVHPSAQATSGTCAAHTEFGEEAGSSLPLSARPVAQPFIRPAPETELSVAGSEESTKSRRSQRPAAIEERLSTAIRVNIGRIEVRASAKLPLPARKQLGAARPALSLNDYLEQRKRGIR